LTFDDGPNDIYTPQILEILKSYNVKATFFVCGKNAERYPHILKRIAQEGHSIGNHTYSHNRLLTFLGLLKREVEITQKLITAVTSHTTTLFRPPWGFAPSWLKRYLMIQGFRLILWDIDPKDWRQPPSDEIVRRIMMEVRDDAIVLLHDGDGIRQKGTRQNTVNALPHLIQLLLQQGYNFLNL